MLFKRQRERESCIHWFIPQCPQTAGGTRPGWKEQLGAPSGSPTQVLRTQVLEPLSLPPGCALAGSWIRSWWNVGILSCNHWAQRLSPVENTSFLLCANDLCRHFPYLFTFLYLCLPFLLPLPLSSPCASLPFPFPRDAVCGYGQQRAVCCSFWTWSTLWLELWKQGRLKLTCERLEMGECLLHLNDSDFRGPVRTTWLLKQAMLQ